jgi:hypothetical protein
MLSIPVLLTIVLLSACDSPPKEPSPPASAPAEVGTRTAEPEAKVVPSRAPPIEGEDGVGEPAGVAEPAPPPTEAAPPAGAEVAPAGADAAPAGADAAADEAPPAAKAKAKNRAAPEASAAGKTAEGRPAKVFTDCLRTETFADGHCYSSRDVACKALSCAGKCIQARSMPAQVSCG